MLIPADGNAHLYISYEDTFEVDEVWIFDFQPYEFGGVTPIVTTGMGSLVAGNTGTCSNVFTDTEFNESVYIKHMKLYPSINRLISIKKLTESTLYAKN